MPLVFTTEDWCWCCLNLTGSPSTEHVSPTEHVQHVKGGAGLGRRNLVKCEQKSNVPLQVMFIIGYKH